MNPANTPRTSAHLLVGKDEELTSIRPYWRCYYADTKAVVYVVDSTDRERLNINKALLTLLPESSRLVDPVHGHECRNEQ
jgi:hypothetical protein